MLYLSLSRVCNLFPFLYQTVYGRGSPCILHLSFNFDFGPAFTVMDSTTGSSSFNLGGAEKKSTIKINWLILIFWSNHMNPTTQKLVKMKIKVTVLRNFFKKFKNYLIIFCLIKWYSNLCILPRSHYKNVDEFWQNPLNLMSLVFSIITLIIHATY